MIDDGRICASAVQRLLDGQYIRIDGGQRYEVDYRCKRLIGVMQQDVLLGQYFKDVLVRQQLIG